MTVLEIDLLDETKNLLDEDKQLVENILQFAAEYLKLSKGQSCHSLLQRMKVFARLTENIGIKIKQLMLFRSRWKKWATGNRD